ncbi:serologically defined colon cancer antigen 1 [Drechmeria coniospora]|uniref:Ribosome quality control complex subunit 2 n=1 Tax=Drechmeria coniospora TaxID=98403 RepID=A0A151GU64_DRECN|nr:serologically defined colon cancer antigen 1 [Drechmeria coniospora]KYK60654.1 serologically defined colon cancer antigen 1 [Drechmeria coniospora]
MKQRFSSLDVKVIAHELNDCLVSLRCANVYDLSSKILLIKFAKPDVKKQLVIDIGFRCHLTEFARTTAAAPSAFVARLRKVLKTRRLTSVSQVGTDRVLEFRFSDGQYRLFLEFFASGNIILTDADLKILTIARNVAESEGQEPQRVGLQYCLDNRLNYHEIPPISKDRIRNGLKSAVEKSRQNAAATKKAKGKPGGDLRKCLAVSITELPPVLVDHVLHCNNFDTSVKLDDLLENNTLLDQLVRLLGEARKQVDAITSSPVCKGYIFAKRNDGRPAPGNSPAGAVSKRDGLLYEDFHPFVPQKFQNDPSITVLEIQGYNQTVDDFFSSLEGQKLETRLSEREATARRKLEAARLDQSKRIEGLQSVQEINFRKAAAIEANVERVQEAMDSVNGLIAEGMDWVDISRLIEREKKRHNPVAELIVLPLKLAENTITLHIAEEEFDDEEEDDPYETDDSDRDAEADGKNMNKNDQAQMGLTVDINLTMSPWGNAREYHDQRRSAAVKQEKTQLQATKALKSTEQKINEDLKKGLKQEKALLQPIRTQMWFEKFIWFISSDGYLVIGGKDPAQNEMLYRRYLRKGDVYCHADLKGASSIVIKNNPSTPGAPIPPATLSQAGSLAVCSSEAWDSKAGMGAWWVNADQVSKSATTGDFLPIGSFMVKGEKNFLPPAQLLLGLGIMFKISDESKAKHVKHRLNDDSLAVASRAAELGSPDDVNESTFAKDKSLSADVEESSDDDSDGGKAGDDARDNPLQAFNNRGDDDALETVQKDISSLKVSESVASEGEVEQEDADTAKDAEFDAQDGEELASEPASEAPPTSPSRGTASSQVGTVAINKKLPAKRGQKGKAKKIASKYKDQDEEDRIAAEALIGATTGQKRAEEEMKAKADRAAELEAAKERRRAQHLRNQKTTAEHEEARRVMMDQDIAEPEPDETESATSLDVLVGTPLPGDEILEAIPVCAPWTALGKLKYRIKLQPGAMKKGKAVKEIVEKWKMDSGKKGAVDETARDAERMWPREVELIKALKPEEVMNSVPVGKVKIMTSGGLSGSGSGKGKGGKGKEQGKGGRGGRGSKK